VSLYLQIAVGDGIYLLEAARVREIRDDIAADEMARWPGGTLAKIDLRRLFAAAASAPGACVVFAQSAGPPAALVVDRVDGLLQVGSAEFYPLPPIGPLGALIDAVAVRGEDQHPRLRLRGERTLRLTAALG
jgi:chemotaxis signal transduction protein